MEQQYRNKPLVFAHIGDLHITGAKEKNYTDFLSILIQLELECGRSLDFIYLPGDIADQGQMQQYRLVATALKITDTPVHMIGGDHDMEEGSLQNFYTGLPSEKLPKAVSVQGVRCLFLDVNGPGSGGPDFRLGEDQLRWLSGELERNPDGDTVLFMHTYPADLALESEKQALLRLMAEHEITLVDMGHTHYNELANDGTTIYAATRSTGQIEEGAVGYSLVSIDQGIVSWRFKELEGAFPFVLITAPADYRLLRKPAQAVSGTTQVRAVVFGGFGIREVSCWLENGVKTVMAKDEHGVWTADIFVPGAGLLLLTVEATDSTGRPGRHQIQLAGDGFRAPERQRNGSDAASIGAWIGNGIPGTQLGPNRNAKPLKKKAPKK